MAGATSDHRLRQADRIVHATLQLVFEHGVSALSMVAIARAAGVSRQTLYKYFPDVESVLRAAVSSSHHDTGGIEAAATPVDQLTTFVRYVFEAAAAGHPSPAALEPLLAPDTRAEVQAHADQVRGVLAGILRRGMDDGSFRADLDPDTDAEIVYHTVMALAGLVAGAGDAAGVTARAEQSILAMVGSSR